MAYVTGFFAADGNIITTRRGTHYISFYSADREILMDIQRCMQSSHKLSTRKTLNGCVYKFQIGSRYMYETLRALGFTEGKSKRMIMPYIPPKYVPDFVRGYFDGDGNVWIGTHNKRRNKPTKVIQVAFTSGSRSFLYGLWSVLKSEGIKGGSLFDSRTKNYSRLLFSTLDALKLAEIMYNGHPKLFLKRKRLRFEEFRKMRP